MKIQDLKHKNVCILGYGREGISTLRALSGIVPPEQITIADANASLEIDGYASQTGSHYLHDLERFDVIIKSPGIPPLPEIEAVRAQGKVTGALQIFMDTVREAGSVIIGVTGTKGKSTTSSLIYQALKRGEHPSFLAGNIGSPVFEFMAEAREGVIFVIEMSSYQLMDVTAGPDVAVITSFFPDHLDYHGSLEAYFQAKSRIAVTQSVNDVIFYNASSVDCQRMATLSPGQALPFSASESPVGINETHLIGEHNLGNLAAAYKAAACFGVSQEQAAAAFRDFRGLPHRLELLGEVHGISWVDDAISTTPESTIAAIKALENQVDTIVLGGLDRGYDFTQLGEVIQASAITNAILLPGSGEAIRRAIESSSDATRVQFFEAKTMDEVVRLAIEHTEPGKTCLLSTASPSYNSFKNFEEKGDLFKQAIHTAA